MTRHYLIVNPESGGGTGARAVPFITNRLRALQLPFDLVQTERPSHATELARQASLDGYDVVVAVGGDGTANEVLNGLMLAKKEGSQSTAMGVLCVGRGNDLAFGLGIPHDLAAGCESLSVGHRCGIDIGRVVGGRFPEGRYFGNGVESGLTPS